jgi:large subunit ribosomal protein L21
MNAVIKIGGKQYYVTEGSEIFVEKVEGVEAGNEVEFNEILMVNSKVGNPYVTNAKVLGEVIKNGKQRKIKIFKYKNKTTSSRRTQGHRQPYTKIKITKISA